MKEKKNETNISQNDSEIFLEFIKHLKKEIKKYPNFFDKNTSLIIDENELTLTAYLDCRNDDKKLTERRIKSVKKMKINDLIEIKVTLNGWEVFNKNGSSLGEIFKTTNPTTLYTYSNYINFSNGKIVNIIPKKQTILSNNNSTLLIQVLITKKDLSNLSDSDIDILDKILYRVEKKETKILHWIGPTSIKNAIIPNTIEGKPVTEIPISFFNTNILGPSRGLNEIIIQEGIKRIEEGVFYKCTTYKKILFPASIEYISNDLFSEPNDKSKKDFFLKRSTVYIAPRNSYAEKFLTEYESSRVGLLKVCNDTSKTSMDYLNSISLFNFILTKNTLKLSFLTYYGENRPNVIVIPDKINNKVVKEIDLENIPNFIEKLIIPSSVEKIHNINSEEFGNYYGEHLKQIEIDTNNKYYYSDGKAIYSKNKNVLIRFIDSKTKEYNVPQETYTIDQYAFSNKSKLIRVTLPSTLQTIKTGAFLNCKSLDEVEGIEVVKNVKGTIFDKGYPLMSKKDFIITGTTISKCNIYNQKVIEIPEGIKKIGASAFSLNKDNDKVTEIIMPDSVEKIESCAFEGRKNLKKINISNGIKEIPYKIFDGCDKLETLYLPASIEIIDIEAFPKKIFKRIEVDENNKKYCSIDGMLLTKDKKQLLYVPPELPSEQLIIPTGVEVIDKKVFKDNDKIIEIELPDSIKKIEQYAFSNCKRLKKIKLPKDLEIIEQYTFKDCKELEEVIWPDKIKKIKNNAFQNTKLSNLLIPKTVNYIEDEAFANISSKKVTLPKTVKKIGFGIFFGIPEIEVYDTFDDNVKKAEEAIDIINGKPNSMIGYLGLYERSLTWLYISKFGRKSHTITVLSNESGEVKYKVWMGAEPSQMEYTCFLSSAWGKNATFAFRKLDEYFPYVKGTENQIMIAKYKLKYPIDLTKEAEELYRVILFNKLNEVK